MKSNKLLQKIALFASGIAVFALSTANAVDAESNVSDETNIESRLTGLETAVGALAQTVDRYINHMVVKGISPRVTVARAAKEMLPRAVVAEVDRKVARAWVPEKASVMATVPVTDPVSSLHLRQLKAEKGGLQNETQACNFTMPPDYGVRAASQRGHDFATDS